MYLLIILFPLLGAIFAGLFGRFIGRTGSLFITTFFLFLSFCLSIFIFYEVGLSQSVCSVKLFS